MGSASLRPSTVSPSVKWALYAGVYAFLCGAVLLLPLGAVADTLVEILTLPRGFTTVLVSGSGAVIGAVVWWTVVERRDAYAYLLGGTVGLLTALFTVLLWAALVAIVYGPSAALAGGVVIVFVLVVIAPVAFVAGLPLMYARRLDESVAEENEHTV